METLEIIFNVALLGVEIAMFFLLYKWYNKVKKR